MARRCLGAYRHVLTACLAMACVALVAISFLQTNIEGQEFENILECHVDVNKSDHVDKPGDEETEAEFARRREMYMDVCSNMKATFVGSSYRHYCSNLAVCHTPKVGCTFWRRMMVFLNTPNRPWRSPFDINRYEVHHKVPTIKLNIPISHAKSLSTFDRVLYARDPYRRLWSVYIDKIILPNSWKDFGLSINRLFKLGQNECPLKISFEHFLRFAIYKHKDSHWNPINVVCDPCSFKPQFIGKMETFSRDTEYILRKRGLDHLLHPDPGRDHAEDELLMLIDYHYKLHYTRSINKKCLNETTLAERLWRAFQLNGYFALDDRFPDDLVNTSMRGRYSSDKIKEIFVGHYRVRKRTKSEIKQQREVVLKDAYRAIPMDLKNDIRKKYDADFKLFGYDPTPSIVFSNT